ncbi:long-chain-fatty-acid--CoA ligase [Actinomycetota bacterium]|nr:long-chain-fatty-acid--CoA ligase [Actinomycetota bacterium]
MEDKTVNTKFNTNQSIYQAWSAANRENGDVPAIEYFGNVWTFAEIEELIDKYARVFMSLGLTASGDTEELGTTVSFCVPTLPSTVFGFYALNKLGITANFISKEVLTQGEAEQLAETNTDTLFLFDQFCPAVAEYLSNAVIKNIVLISLSDDCPNIPEGVPDQLRLALTMSGVEQIKNQNQLPNVNIYSLKDFLSLGDDSLQVTSYYDASGERTAVILYTGGSTGLPKGVEKRDREFIAMANKYPHIPIDLNPSDRNGVFIPPNHPTAFVHSLVVPSFFGTTQVLQPIYNKETFVNDIYNLKLNLAVAAPSHYATFLLSNLPDGALSSFAYPFTGGEAVSPQLADEVNLALSRLGVQNPLIVGYGMSEIGPMTMLSSGDSTLRNKVGKLLPNVEARILDRDGNKLGVNQRGKLEIKSLDTSMKRYLNKVELTTDFWTNDGFAKTQDIASVDENGNYTVYGRANDTFADKNGQEHYLFDIEYFLYENRAVAEAEAVNLTTDSGDVPVAFVVLKAGVEDNESDIIRRIYTAARQSLPAEEIPAGIKILEKFGTNPVSTKRDYASLKLIREGYLHVNEDGEVVEVGFEL